MRTKNKLFVCLVSCSEDEPTPEVVENPLDADVVVSGEANSATSLNIAGGAVTKATDITVTEYRKGAKKGDVHASLSTINCQPDGLIFEKPVNIVKSTTGTFNLIYQGKPATISVPVKTYNGISTKISYQYGSSHTDHSGGVIK